MATFEKRVAPDGRVTYRAKVRLTGHPPASATFERLTDARQWATRAEAAMREGRYFPERAAQSRTLAEAIDRYLLEVIPTKKEKTQGPQRQQLAWWKSQMGHLPLAACTPARISEARSRLLREPIPPRQRAPVRPYRRAFRDGRERPELPDQTPKLRSPSTGNRYLAVLSHLFTVAAREWQWVGRSPMDRVSKGRESRGRVRFLDDDERERLLAASKASQNPELYLIVVLALSTGMRRAEVLGLRWRDLDLTRRVLTLHDTKNGDRRALPLVAPAMEQLRERAKAGPSPDDRLFHGDPRTAWENALERAGIQDFRFHDLRHSCASYLAMSGASPVEIGAVLGHRTLAMVRRYAHLSEVHTADLVELVSAKLFQPEDDDGEK